MLCFRLSTTLLLAAMCSLMSAVASFEEVITCESGGNVQQLSCEFGVIKVQAAMYGRQDRETCSEGRSASLVANTRCSQRGTLDVFKGRCDGRKECQITFRDVRTPDPCRGIVKYLNTTYDCFPAIRVIACEGSTAHLHCGKGQNISVYGAHYGRTNQVTCSLGRPSSQVRKDDCFRSATKKVSDSCNKKNSCDIKVSNTVFGDPCGGTYKYLEVAYICLYP